MFFSSFSFFEIGRKKWEGFTYVNGHLDARFRAGALVDDVEAVGLVELLEGGHDRLLGPAHRLVGRERLGLVARGQAVHLVREPVLLREVEPRAVDVERDDARGALGPREHAGEQPDRADAEDEHGLVRGGAEPASPGGVDQHAQRLGERGLLERNVVGKAGGEVLLF